MLCAKAVWAQGGDYAAIVVHRSAPTVPDQKKTVHTRGEIKGFSRKSRKRLLDVLSQIPRRAISGGVLLITLTYPSQYPSDPSVFKAHLFAFRKRLEREHGDVSVVWRLERQSRGAPHYHLLVFGLKRVDIGWLSRAWYEIVGSGDEKHLRAGTNVVRVRGWRELTAYVSKYVAKVDSHGLRWGRLWGVWNKEGLGIVLNVVYISVSTAVRLLERMCEVLKGKGVVIENYGRLQGMTCYGFRIWEYIE